MVNIVFCPHHHLKSRDHLRACRAMSRRPEESEQEITVVEVQLRTSFNINNVIYITLYSDS